MTGSSSEEVQAQNLAIIRLLARLAFKENEIRQIVTFKKKAKARAKYIQGYNACDGATPVGKIAKIVGVDHSVMSRVLDDWEELGIVYRSRTPKQTTCYTKVIKI